MKLLLMRSEEVNDWKMVSNLNIDNQSNQSLKKLKKNRL